MLDRLQWQPPEDLLPTVGSVAPLDGRGADWSGRDLAGVDLRGAVLCRVDLRGADLSACDLDGADLRLARFDVFTRFPDCLLYTSPSPRDRQKSRMPSSA